MHASCIALYLHLHGMVFALCRFISYPKLRRVALQFLAEQLSDADIARLRAAMARADTDMDGRLSFGQLKEVLRAQGFDVMRQDLREALEGECQDIYTYILDCPYLTHVYTLFLALYIFIYRLRG